jgi:hypothetical protein
VVAPRTLVAAAPLAAAWIAGSVYANAGNSAKRELTPADAIATVRIIQNQLLSGQPADDGFISPDGRRYLIRLVYGDRKRNGVWMDLLTGSLTSLEAAARLKQCAHLFTTGLGSATSARSAEADPDTTNVIRWVDNTHVAFLWSDEHAVRQVVSVDLIACKHQFLTHAPADVFSFLPISDGTLLFNAQVPAPTGRAEQLWAHGFTVGDSSDGLSILQGQIEDASAVEVRYKNAWFIQSHGRLHSLNIDGNPFDPSNPYSRDLSLGPSGRYAVTWIGVTSIPKGWEHYSNPSLQAGLTSTDKVRLPVRYVVVDLRTGESRMLWNSPLSLRAQVRWSPSEDSALLAPTYLPVDANNSLGLAGNAAAEVDVRTGRYRLLPIDLTDRTVLKAQWLNSDEIAITSTNNLGVDPRTERFMRSSDTWQTSPGAGPDVSDTSLAPIHLETRQSLNSPPQIFAVDTRTGQRRLIVDPNPHLLNDFKLGRVERMSGTLPTGQHWIAQLIYPADYRPDVKYPLVIQSTYGPAFGAEEFSLEGAWGYNGMGLGPTQVASYPGQLLATRNIAVLELQVLHAAQGFKGAEDRQLVFEALGRQLTSSGLVDEGKIALAGFSQNGYWVEYTLAHSAFPFAAAIAGDNYEPSYLQSALGNWRQTDVELNGGPAFGDGLLEWLAHAPGFNAEHIHTPLLITGQSGGILMIIGEWEIYSRLRHLHKPAQIYMMPQADKHPSHTPQNPEQIIAIQETALDWFDFWLTGREDASPMKREQYARWHRLLASSAVPNP